MILVTLGTQDKSFIRLLEAVDNAIKKGAIKEKVVVQAGYTKYDSKNMELFDYIPANKFEELVKECDLLITHGGVGSILTGVTNDKKVIVAARLSEYGEHVNDHQLQIVEEFVNAGYVLELKDFKKLDKLINQISKFKPKKFIKGSHNMINLIEGYIDNL
jgi:Uncharacterized conserved protein